MDEIVEAELISAGKSGAVIEASVNGMKRKVEAALLRECCYKLRYHADTRGLKLKDAIVVGCLDLTGLAVPFPLHFRGCEFESALVVEGAELFELSLTDCPRLPGLLGDGLRLRRDLDLSRSRVVGAVWASAGTSKRSAIWLCDSEIEGRLLCVDTTIDGLGDRSIRAERIHVGEIRLSQFHSRGEIRLIGARVGGSLDLSGATIESSEGPAIDLDDATVAGSVFLIADAASRRPAIRGRIDMGGTRIAGRLLISDAVIEAHTDVPKTRIYTRSTAAGTAINATRLSVGAEVVLAGHCEVTGRIDMSMGTMSSVSIGENCMLRAPGRTALDLTNAEIRSLLRVDENAAIEGTVRLYGAGIHGTLALHGQLSQPEHQSLIGGSAMTVDGDVYLNGLRTRGGQVNFRGAILGSLHAGGAQLDNPRGSSLHLSAAVVKGPVRLANGFTSTGRVALNRTLIEGRLQLTGGTFNYPEPAAGNKHGQAIAAISATVRGGMDLGWALASPSVDFTDATTTSLADDPAAWPARFTIAGLTYQRFELPQDAPPRPVWDHVARCAWLRHQSEFDSGPYEQAARVFRQHGYTSEAEQILMAQRKHAQQVGRPTATQLRRAMQAAYATIGYGYRPWRVLWLLAALLVLVALSLELPAIQATLRATNGNGAVYTTSGFLTTSPATLHPKAHSSTPGADACGDGEVRCFSPVLYAVDTVIPLITLDQRSTWYPDPHVPGGEFVLWWLNLATLLGWLLSSIFVLSLARLSRSP